MSVQLVPHTAIAPDKLPGPVWDVPGIFPEVLAILTGWPKSGNGPAHHLHASPIRSDDKSPLRFLRPEQQRRIELDFWPYVH